MYNFGFERIEKCAMGEVEESYLYSAPQCRHGFIERKRIALSVLFPAILFKLFQNIFFKIHIVDDHERKFLLLNFIRLCVLDHLYDPLGVISLLF